MDVMAGSTEIGVEMCTKLGPGAAAVFVTGAGAGSGTWVVDGAGVGLGLGTDAGDNRLAETEV